MGNSIFYPDSHEFSNRVNFDALGLEYFNQVFNDEPEFRDSYSLDIAISLS